MLDSKWNCALSGERIGLRCNNSAGNARAEGCWDVWNGERVMRVERKRERERLRAWATLQRVAGGGAAVASEALQREAR